MGLSNDKPVVVPWDFSDYSLEALKRAIELLGAPEMIHVVYVMQNPVASELGGMWEVVSPETMQEQSAAAFRRLLEKHPDLAGVKFVGLVGDPGGELVDYAVRVGAGLIVISSHGRTGLVRWMLGSVAERVVRLAQCPVLVLKKASAPS